MFTDTHCHLDFDAYDADRPEVVRRARQAGLKFIVNPGVDLPSAGNVLRLTRDYPGFIFAAVGIHPNYSADCQQEQIARLDELARNPGVVAIGEIGLDYYWITARPTNSAGVCSAVGTHRPPGTARHYSRPGRFG